jgi:prevent-host-death family protein
MEAFTVRDLRERTGELIRGAEEGHLSVVTKHGNPVFVAVPFDEVLLESGVRVSLALRLFDDGTLTLAQAAKVAGVGVETFIEHVGAAGLTVVRTPADELDSELEVIAQHERSR